MSPSRRSAVLLLSLLAVGIVWLSGCSVVSAAHKIVNTVEGNKHVIDGFTDNLKSGAPSSFEATYSTTGTSPATVTYAVKPPNEVALTDTESGSSGTDIDVVVNGAGSYYCTRPVSDAAPWSCQKGEGASAAQGQALLDIYTPAHWVTFLDDFSLAAGFAGDKVTTSTMSVNGFAMSCVDFVAPGVPGTSTICSTAQHLLGSVQVASSATSFEIKSFSTSPPASLFTVPPGATITTAPAPTSTPS
jgi:hypothetical protein